MDGCGGIQVTADRGGIAAGRDVHIACDLNICPRCETRLMRRDRDICRCCARSARLARIQRDGTLALLGYGVCVGIGIQCLSLAGYRHHWPLAAMIGLLVFGAGYCAWLRLMIWAQRDAQRQWRRWLYLLRYPGRWCLTRSALRVPMRAWSAMTNPTRRAPGPDEGMRMEPNPLDEARAEKLRAEAAKLMEQRALIRAQTIWFPVVIVASIFFAAILLVKFLL